MAVLMELKARAGRVNLWCKVGNRNGWNSRVFSGILREVTFQGKAVV